MKKEIKKGERRVSINTPDNYEIINQKWTCY